jgi:FHA domain
MLFHVTITHSDADCPGRHSGEVPGLSGSDESAELAVTQHSLVWGAACMIWGEPEHVAFAVLEAADVDTVNRYFQPMMPATWTTRVLPVFASPDQVSAVRQLLATPAATPQVADSDQPTDERDAADVDTLRGVEVAVAEPIEQDEEAPDRRVTRAVAQPIPPEPAVTSAPQPGPPVPDTTSVTRIVDRRVVLEAANAAAPQPPDQLAVVSGLSETEPAYSPSESSTVILEPKVQRLKGLRLEASAGPAHGSVFHVGEGGATLGRLPENTICLTDGRLSRHHARIDFRDGAFWISDLGSQNGTLVNDRPVTEAARLQPGDTVDLGTTRLVVTQESDD